MSDNIEDVDSVASNENVSLRSIAISLKRIADTVEAALGILIDDEIDEGHDPYEQMANQS